MAVIQCPCERLNSFMLLDSEAAAKVMVELLGSYTEDNASQARVDAHRYTEVLLWVDPQHIQYLHASASSSGVSSVLWKTPTPSWWTTCWHWNLSVSWRGNSSTMWVLTFMGTSEYLFNHPIIEHLPLFFIHQCENLPELGGISFIQ